MGWVLVWFWFGSSLGSGVPARRACSSLGPLGSWVCFLLCFGLPFLVMACLGLTKLMRSYRVYRAACINVNDYETRLSVCLSVLDESTAYQVTRKQACPLERISELVFSLARKKAHATRMEALEISRFRGRITWRLPSHRCRENRC